MSKINYKKIGVSIISFGLVFLLPILFSHAYGPASETIQNPLGSNDVWALLGKIMDLVIKVGSVVVVFFVIYSGYKFVAARGNETKIDDAKNTFYATIIGAAILLGADVIANLVVNTVKTTTGVR
jgi:mannose/fructose/N-acetylgalactosamine-specific phosphotransferase system component IID